jgi:hypothetical protein
MTYQLDLKSNKITSAFILLWIKNPNTIQYGIANPEQRGDFLLFIAIFGTCALSY